MFKKPIEENKELEELKARCDEYLNGWKRAKADYENLKKDTEKRISELGEYAAAGVILELMPVFNHLKLAVRHIPEAEQNSDWGQGIFHIQKEFADFFKKFEISEIKTVGEKFNHLYHEAVGYEEADEEDDIIVKEVQPGYLIKDKVFLPAKVIVSKAKTDLNNEDGETDLETSASQINNINQDDQSKNTESSRQEE